MKRNLIRSVSIIIYLKLCNSQLKQCYNQLLKA